MNRDRILIPYNKKEFKQIVQANLSGMFDEHPISTAYADLQHRRLLFKMKKEQALLKDIHFPHIPRGNALIKEAEKVRKLERKHRISKSARLKAREICSRESAII